jgi:hypothetical protein
MENGLKGLTANVLSMQKMSAASMNFGKNMLLSAYRVHIDNKN